MKLANLYLIGAPKAGTTSIAAWLGEHPDVFWSTPKEPFYWASDFPAQRHHHGFDSLDEYASLFASPEAQSARWRGDGSTTYLYSRSAVPDILTEVGDQARFVVAVRNPAELVVSYHRTQLLALNEVQSDFVHAWRESLAGAPHNTDALDPKLLDYPMVGAQGAALQRLLRSLDRDRLFVIVFDDLRDEPARVWEDLMRFLDLPSDNERDFRTENESNRAIRWPALRQMVQRPPRLLKRPVSAIRNAAVRSNSRILRKLRSKLWQTSERPAISDDVYAELREYFSPDVKLLQEIVGRSLPW